MLVIGPLNSPQRKAALCRNAAEVARDLRSLTR